MGCCGTAGRWETGLVTSKALPNPGFCKRATAGDAIVLAYRLQSINTFFPILSLLGLQGGAVHLRRV